MTSYTSLLLKYNDKPWIQPDYNIEFSFLTSKLHHGRYSASALDLDQTSSFYAATNYIESITSFNFVVDDSSPELVISETNVPNNNLWFEQIGNDLVITINGTSQQIELENWYIGGQGGQIEAIETSNDNMTLLASDFEAFVTEMSSLTPPSSGTQDYDSTSQTALADELMLWSSI